MSELYWNPRTQSYEYNDYRYVFSNTPKYDNSSENYYKKLTQIRQLPISPLQRNYTTTKRRYFDLNKLSHENLSSDQKNFGKNQKDYHEKTWPRRIGIEDEYGHFIPHYFSDFPMANCGIKESTGKIIANMISGRLFPTKMAYYAGNYNGSFGVVGIDLNHINGVKSLRLDRYLESKGIECGSIVSLLKAYRNGVFNTDLTGSAIAQLMLSMFSIPNAIGEQDPNTRNAILLGPDQKGAKFDSVVRIDFEKNIFNYNHNTSENANFHTYPFGVFHREEDIIEFKENLTKAFKDKNLTPEDANLILALHEITNYATNHDSIEQAMIDADSTESPDSQDVEIVHDYFSRASLKKFADNIIAHSKKYNTEIKDAFSTAALKNNIRINANINELPSLEK